MASAKWIKNAWYVAMCSHDLGQESVDSRIILNVGIVLYRTSEGTAVVLEDRCPHRYAPLSMGKVCGNRIVCGYHGLEFDETGTCVRNPHGQGKIPRAAVTRNFPVAERYGFVWVWMGDVDKLAEVPRIDFLEVASGYKLNTPAYLHMNTPWQLIIDNLVDLSHVSFLHDGLLGTPDMIGARNKVSLIGVDSMSVARFMPNVSPPEYSDLIFLADGQPMDKRHVATWVAPTMILLDINATRPGAPRDEGAGVYAAHLITPETEQSSYYHFAAARWGMVEHGAEENEQIEKRLAAARKHAFANQDDPMMQAQNRVIQRYDGDFKPVMLEIDAGIVRWRRIMEEMVAAEAEA